MPGRPAWVGGRQVRDLIELAVNYTTHSHQFVIELYNK